MSRRIAVSTSLGFCAATEYANTVLPLAALLGNATLKVTVVPTTLLTAE